ncbi:hypothetical protein PV405_35635 [Streptomyces sp. ME02-6979-3A]|uniref:hypothetical protein n=1 Tax=Streptomyces sp. ME02-6979-3A TaxID=3028673 RepID=UPI0029A48009|nr:hypothetical protein [Streptomyces sp. ME02-6979-3A]MDX3329919.1 hypothetical protein [Streptomyces sp. ME02-6979-3A]
MTTDTTPPQPTEPPAVPPLHPDSPPTTPKRPPSPILTGLLGLIIGAGIVGGTWAYTANQTPDAPPTFTLEGSFTLTDGARREGEDNCRGTGGYDDIAEGTSVTVYDAAGGIAATGQLGKSVYTAGLCLFLVTVEDVPKGEKFYQVEVSHRGKVQMTAAEAEAGKLAASLG